MKIKLVKNWQKALKMLSVQANVLCGSLVATYSLMYDQLKDSVDPATMSKIVVGMFVANIVLRLVDQGLGSDE